MNEEDYSNDNFEKFHEPPFKTSKEQNWEQLSAKINTTTKTNNKLYKRRFYMVAASFLLLISLSLTASLYKIEIECPQGEHLSFNLPCNSTVTLNSGTVFKYYPLWWYIARKTELSGEAFFEVSSGKTFTVNSKNGCTQVLGTSFNIFSRENTYTVFCNTGKVKVETQNKEENILLPGQVLSASKNKIQKYSHSNKDQFLGWKSNVLIYTSEPLQHVIEEIERQYDVKIEYKNFEDLKITGSFPLNKDIDSILSVICMTFDIKVNKLSETKYKLIKN